MCDSPLLDDWRPWYARWVEDIWITSELNGLASMCFNRNSCRTHSDSKVSEQLLPLGLVFCNSAVAHIFASQCGTTYNPTAMAELQPPLLQTWTHAHNHSRTDGAFTHGQWQPRLQYLYTSPWRSRRLEQTPARLREQSRWLDRTWTWGQVNLSSIFPSSLTFSPSSDVLSWRLVC